MFAADTYTVRQGAAVINTAAHSESGEHWVCLVVNGDCALYFDSYGRPPWPQLLGQLAAANIQLAYNQTQYQTSSLPACGHYCVYLIRNLYTMAILDRFAMLGDDGVMRAVGACGPRSGQTCKGLYCQ